jgi:hypothetical protein
MIIYNMRCRKVNLNIGGLNIQKLAMLSLVKQQALLVKHFS